MHGHTNLGCLSDRTPDVKLLGPSPIRIQQYSTYEEFGIDFLDSFTANLDNREYKIQYDEIMNKKIQNVVGYFHKVS